MKKDQCEQAIRQLCDEWRKIPELIGTLDGELQFSEFWTWMKSRYPSYTDFRSCMGAEYDAEFWFDQEFEQTGRR